MSLASSLVTSGSLETRAETHLARISTSSSGDHISAPDTAGMMPTLLEAPGQGRGGDQIFIIPGCRTPMLLRTLDIQTGTNPYLSRFERAPYSIVGFCYVHGAMDGELVGGQETLESFAVV